MNMRKLVAAVAAAASVMVANARSLIHYFDFDTLRDGSLAYAGVDKGTRPADFTFKNNGSASLGYTTGALGSDHAFYSSNKSSIWLGDGSASLGCGTTQGFTISFWCKPSASHDSWSDFFGFRVGGMSYRFEYTTANSSVFTLYSSTLDLLSPDTGAGLYYSGAAANTWHHFAIVATPNGTNSLGTCAFFVNGGKVGDVALRAAGDLQQINIGTWQRAGNGTDRKYPANNTGIDEVAVFDYPVTAEQVKWLAKYKPAQPVSGPGRAMPVAWNFDTTDTTVGVAAGNNGSGPDEAFLWGGNNPKATAASGGALNSAYCMEPNNKATWRVYNLDGLGATIGSGYTISFWLKAKAKPGDWHDFFYYCLGDQDWALRFEWYSDNPAHVHAYGRNLTSAPAFTRGAETIDTWQHVCLVWNPSSMTTDIYFGGSRTAQVSYSTLPSLSEPLTTIMLGSQSYDNNKKWRNAGGDTGVFVDELAFFNHSLSTSQIAWLGTHIPCLPPLDATNLVRTVSESGAWAGGLASWTVRDWDEVGEAWTNTTRTTIYPALEDTEAEVAVALADGVELTNDTFVTPKKLVMTAVGASPSAATLKAAEGSRFAPEALEIGEGLQLTVPLYAASVGGTLTLGTGSKITFDVSNYDGIGDVALTAGGIALPAGESDALAHFGVTDNRFVVSLSADGKTVYAKLDNVAATATWTGAGDGTSLDSAANWECCNSSGTVLQNVLPCEFTRVIVCSGSAALNAPVGTTIPWQYLRFEAGTVTLSAAETDWRGLPSLTVPEGVTVNLGGNKLYLNETVTGLGTFTDTAATGGELHFNIPEGVTFENEGSSSHATRTLALTGTLKMVKDGAGTFVASRTGQSYSGGTYVAGGMLRYGSEPSNRILGAAAGDVVVSADGIIDINGRGAAYEHLHVLNGGKMLNARVNMSVNYAQVGNVRLGANSCIEAPYSWGLIGSGYAAQALDLGGYSLSVDVTSNREFYLLNTEIRNGLIDLTHGGWFVTGRSPASGNSNNDIIATNADFRVNAALKLYAKVKARNYEAVWSSNYNEGSAVFEIYGTFKPSAHNYFHGCKMMDGSTIDLSSRTNALPLIAAFTSNSAKTLDFEANKTVYVKFGGYRTTSREPIISWTAKPADIDTVKFKTAPGERPCSFIKKGDGLYIRRGFTILVR